jgi:trigger factor
LEQEYTKAFANEGKRKFAQDLVEDFTESVKISLPDDFLKRWLLVSNEKPVTPEQVEEGYPDFARNLKWQLIVNTISKDNEDVKVTPEDIKTETKAGIIQQFGQMQGFAMDDEQLNDWANEMMGNKEHVQRTYEYLTEQKLIEYIKDKITVNEKTITLDEFKNLK